MKGLCQIDSGSIFVCFIIDCNSLSALIVESLIVDQNVTVWMVIQTVMIIFLKFCDLATSQHHSDVFDVASLERSISLGVLENQQH